MDQPESLSVPLKSGSQESVKAEQGAFVPEHHPSRQQVTPQLAEEQAQAGLLAARQRARKASSFRNFTGTYYTRLRVGSTLWE